MQLNINLLSSFEEARFDSFLNGTNIRGSYNTMQFVLRLRDDVRTALNSEDDDYDRTQAFSTFLHETIHWWQHVGSNFGFLYALSHPAIMTLCIRDLTKLIDKDIKVKSLIKFDYQYYKNNSIADIPEINKILNNYYDVQNARFFASDNKNIYKIIEDKRFFLSVGHCYHIFWSSTIGTLSHLDKNFEFLPKINTWLTNFQKLEQEKITGFGIDAPVDISPLGIKAIFEGQAIYNQLHYLSISLNDDLTIKDCENSGFLYGIYTEAFELFIKETGIKKPNSFSSPIIALFLLVCDISINPTNGFPFDIYDFKNFIVKNDPGIRFYHLCKIIGENPKQYQNSIINYSKDEYINISEELCNAIGSLSPHKSALYIMNWCNNPEILKLLNEETGYDYLNESLPIRLFFSKFLRFQEDKNKHPNLFCWIGHHMTSKNKNIDLKSVEILFNKHQALFIDDFDKEVKPTIFENISEHQTLKTFNEFFKYNIIYDLILKWIEEEGEFNLNYEWLVNKRKHELIPDIQKSFKQAFGISMDELKIL